MEEAAEKRSRKKKPDAKNKRVYARITENESEMLGKICEDLDMSESEAVRCAVRRLYEWCKEFDKNE